MAGAKPNFGRQSPCKLVLTRCAVDGFRPVCLGERIDVKGTGQLTIFIPEPVIPTIYFRPLSDLSLYLCS